MTGDRLQFLPERHTDFVFTVYPEKIGWLSIAVAAVVVVAAVLIAVRAYRRRP